MHRACFLFFAPLLLISVKAAAQAGLRPLAGGDRPVISLRPLPQNFYKQCLPFTCRQELKLQKLTSLPLYVRIGSKDYVDYLERKPGAVRKSE